MLGEAPFLNTETIADTESNTEYCCCPPPRAVNFNTRWSAEDIKRYSLNLPMKSRWVTVLYFMLLVAASILIPVQNRTWAHDTRRLQTPLTQTAGIWTPVAASMKPQPFLGTDMVLNDRCSVFNAANASDGGYYIQSVTLEHSMLDSRYLVLGSLVSAFLFQLLGAFRADWYAENLNLGRMQYGPFFERSISLPLMMVAMCAQLGITDLFSLLNVMTLTWASMVFSFCAEVLFECRGGHLKLWEHGHFEFYSFAMGGAWTTLVMAMCTLYSKIGIADSCFIVNRNTLPGSLTVSVVYVEMLLMGVMLLLQTLSLRFKPSPPPSGPMSLDAAKEEDKERPPQEYNTRVQYTYRLEYMFLAIDVLSKLVFCFLLYSQSMIH